MKEFLYFDFFSRRSVFRGKDKGIMGVFGGDFGFRIGILQFINTLVFNWNKLKHNLKPVLVHELCFGSMIPNPRS